MSLFNLSLPQPPLSTPGILNQEDTGQFFSNSGFDPLKIPGLQAFWISTAGTNTTTSGSYVTSWLSQVGTNISMSNPTLGKNLTYNPNLLNGKPGLESSGSNGYQISSNLSVVGAQTVFILYTLNAVLPGGQSLYSIKDTTSNLFSENVVTFTSVNYTSSSIRFGMQSAGLAVGMNPSPALTTNTPYFDVITWNGGTNTTPGNYQSYLNRVQQTVGQSSTFSRTATNFASCFARVDGSNNLTNPVNGRIFILGVVNRVMLANEINQLGLWVKNWAGQQ